MSETCDCLTCRVVRAIKREIEQTDDDRFNIEYVVNACVSMVAVIAGGHDAERDGAGYQLVGRSMVMLTAQYCDLRDGKFSPPCVDHP